MRTKLHKIMLSTLLAASVAVMMPATAHANRSGPGGGGGYVPPPTYGQNPNPEVSENPYESPVVAPTEVPVDLPGVTDPGAGLAGGGDPLAEVPATTDLDVLGGSNTGPEVDAPSGGVLGGVLSRTGAETMPLARAGLAALTLGAGLVMLGRRRRQAAAAA